MGLDDFSADELLDLLRDLNVTEEWQILSIRDHWKQQYKNICGLFAADKVELNKHLLRLNKAYNVFTSIEKDQRRELYLRFHSLLLSDQIDLLEKNNEGNQFSVDPDFFKNRRNLDDIADQKQRDYEISKERRRRELEEAAAWKADREIDPARRRSQEELEQSNSNEQSMPSSTADASDRTSVNNETHSQPGQDVNNNTRDERMSNLQSAELWYQSKLVHNTIIITGAVSTILLLLVGEFRQEKTWMKPPLQNPPLEAIDKLSRVERLHTIKGSENEVVELTTEILAIHQADDSYFYGDQTDDVYFYRAYAKYNLGDLQGAIADYNQAIAINPEYEKAYINRGIAKHDIGDSQGAIADSNQAIAINPKNAGAYFNRGSAKRDLGDKQGAIDDYTQAIAINPQYADAYITRGNAKSALGDKQGAITDFNKAIAINPKYATVYRNRGIAFEETGDISSACKDWRVAASLGDLDAADWVRKQCQ